MAESKKPRKVKVTAKGVTVSVDPNVFDDIDLLEDIGECQDGNMFAFPRVLKKMFGRDYQNVHDKLKGKRGVTTVTEMTEFFTEVMKALEAVQAKN